MKIIWNKIKEHKVAIVIFIFFIIMASLLVNHNEADVVGKQENYSDRQMFIATVLEVTDGDTIKVNINGIDDKIRLCLVDTPETRHKSKPIQKYGREASEFTKSLIHENQEIYFTLDEDHRDMYGRLLAYVYLDEYLKFDEMLNVQLLNNGLACVSYYKPNGYYKRQFENVQEVAKMNGLGVWNMECISDEEIENMSTEKLKEIVDEINEGLVEYWEFGTNKNSNNMEIIKEHERRSK